MMRFCFSVMLATLLFSSCNAPMAHSTNTSAGILARTGVSIPAPLAQLPTPLPPGLSLDQPISSDDAAAIAIWNNAQLRADLAAIGLAEADLKDASLLLRNPRLDTLFPVGAKPFDLLFNFPLEVFLQRPRRIAVSEAALNQLAQSLIQNGVNTARDARLAFTDLWQAEQRTQLAAESVELRDRIMKLTGARFSAGDISELETIAAKSDAASAIELHQRSIGDVQLARQRLSLSLGLVVGQSSYRLSPPSILLRSTEPLDVLLEKTMSARADLRAAEIAVTTATKRAGWERRRFLWLSAQLSSKGVGNSGVLSGPGLSFEAPIFNRNQGMIARAEAEVESASRQYLALKQRAAFEVADARGQLDQARLSFANIRDGVLPPLERSVRLAEDQYKNGDVAFLFVLEQNRAWLDARQRLIDAQAAILRAQAQLERSVGSK